MDLKLLSPYSILFGIVSAALCLWFLSPIEEGKLPPLAIGTWAASAGVFELVRRIRARSSGSADSQGVDAKGGRQ